MNDKSKEPEVELTKLHYENGITDVEFQGSAVHHLADMLAEQFRASGAVNYLEMKLSSKELGPITMTMQRDQGLSPANKADMLCKLVRADDMAGLVELVTQWDYEQSETLT